MHPLFRSLAMACAMGACLGQPSIGGATESKQQCVQAYEDAQTAKRTGKLLEATTDLLFCSSAECPEVMHADCQRWLAEVEVSIPTVVFRVTTGGGAVPQWATISVDGAEPVALDGRAVGVDPGRHTITFAAKGLRTASKVFDFSEGEKLRREVILLEPVESNAAGGVRQLPKPTPSVRRSGVRVTLPLVLAASTTAIGAIGATYFGLKARADDRDLNNCSPHCSRDAVDRVSREYLFTNVSLGIAAAGLVTTTLVALLQSKSVPPSPSTQVALDVSANQANLSLNGHF